jgi:hypothetical protein
MVERLKLEEVAVIVAEPLLKPTTPARIVVELGVDDNKVPYKGTIADPGSEDDHVIVDTFIRGREIVASMFSNLPVITVRFVEFIVIVAAEYTSTVEVAVLEPL